MASRGGATAVVVASALVAASGCSKQADPPPKKTTGSAGSATAPGSAGSAGSANTAGSAGSAATDPALVARGKYLATIAGCETCHTNVMAPGAKPFAGGLEQEETFGVWRSSNITPDRDTGIGAWTDAQILAAIREGKRPDGTRLKPIMPYPMYNAMTDADGAAIVAYLRTLTPVANKVAPSELKLPDAPVPPPANHPVDATPLARGAYLTALMHCDACHTPIDLAAMRPDMSKRLSGGMPMELPRLGEGVLHPSNITSDAKTGIGSWTEPQILDAVLRLKRPDGTTLAGPMMFYVTAWNQLTADDQAALAAFIKSVPAVENKVAPSTFKMRPMPGGPGGGSAAPAGSSAPAGSGSGSAAP